MLTVQQPRKSSDVVMPIHDRYGRTIGWLEEDTIRHLDGGTAAFVSGEAIFNDSGTCIGFIHDRYFRDLQGDAVAFLPGATGGPPLPLPERSPMRPPFSYAPMRPIGSRPPVRPKAPLWSVDWSPILWCSFLTGNHS